MVPTTQLRVFAPLESFPPRERERWAAYVADGRGLTRAEVEQAEAQVAARSLRGGTLAVGDVAAVRRAGDRILVCPLQLELRVAHAFAAFRRTVPGVVIEHFVPPGSGLDRDPPLGSAPHVLDEPWSVPLHWFVAFAPDERRLRDLPGSRGPSLRYLTTVAQAVWRLEHAVAVVEEAITDADEVLLSLAELAGWLSGFADDAVVELDLATVGATLPAQMLRSDRTCSELQEALTALDAGDAMGAAARYAACRSRWSHHRARQHAS